jgi:undecaprenyl diphosphate synthase
MQKLPRHIAIVMDGNNRWALYNKTDIEKSYRRGSEVAENIIRYCEKIGIEYLTLYAFSLENWNRPKEEVDLIMDIFKEAIISQLQEISKDNIRVIFIGDRSLLRQDIILAMEDLEAKSKDSKSLVVRIAISYGSRQEIIKAAEEASKSHLPYEEAFKMAINRHNIPDPDLVIRTSGEMRISNFLLWEIAYSELYFTKTLWPDFDEVALQSALEHFLLRERRFGKR